MKVFVVGEAVFLYDLMTEEWSKVSCVNAALYIVHISSEIHQLHTTMAGVIYQTTTDIYLLTPDYKYRLNENITEEMTQRAKAIQFPDSLVVGVVTEDLFKPELWFFDPKTY
jgi:hypothetical protein